VNLTHSSRSIFKYKLRSRRITRLTRDVSSIDFQKSYIDSIFFVIIAIDRKYRIDYLHIKCKYYAPREAVWHEFL